MSYSFWETVRGHALVDVLTRELPELNEKNNKQFEELSDILSGIHQANMDLGNRILEQLVIKNAAVKKQYTMTDDTDCIGKIIEKEISNGARLIGVYDSGFPLKTAVFEKDI